jgi:hypothetical protein
MFLTIILTMLFPNLILGLLGLNGHSFPCCSRPGSFLFPQTSSDFERIL